MTVSIKFDGKTMGESLRHGLKIAQDRIQANVQATMAEASRRILERGRADISNAGNFGSRWTSGLHAEPVFTPARSSITVTHDVPYFWVFEKGATIKGKPLLWIPLSFAGVPKGTSARDFPGGLFYVERKSGAAPLLLSRATGEPKFVGKQQVTIPRKFHIRDIVRDVGNSLRAIYSSFYRSGQK